jgi:hypothetical protein
MKLTSSRHSDSGSPTAYTRLRCTTRTCCSSTGKQTNTQRVVSLRHSSVWTMLVAAALLPVHCLHSGRGCMHCGTNGRAAGMSADNMQCVAGGWRLLHVTHPQLLGGLVPCPLPLGLLLVLPLVLLPLHPAHGHMVVNMLKRVA